MDGLEAVKKIAKACDGTITEVGILPDNSGFAIMSMPLRKDHWIYQGDRTEAYGTFNVPPMVFRMGGNQVFMMAIVDKMPPEGGTGQAEARGYTKEEMAERIRAAGRYAVRCATMNGKEMDFDPDALLQNLVTGFLGYNTDTGLSDDE
jgi:hypothetical protein